MSVTAVGGVAQAGSSGHQCRAALTAMEHAVQKGDLAAAQLALVAYKAEVVVPHANVSASASGHVVRPSIQVDLTALMSAVRSGDITGAKIALSILQQDRVVVQHRAAMRSASAADALGKEFAQLMQDAQAGQASPVRGEASAAVDGAGRQLTAGTPDGAPGGGGQGEAAGGNAWQGDRTSEVAASAAQPQNTATVTLQYQQATELAAD